MTITIDDAGSGDLLFGVVIGAYQDGTQDFKYDVIDVKYFQPELFRKKQYLKQSSEIVFQLLGKLKPEANEEIHLCQGYIFDEASEELIKKFGEERIKRIRVVGEPQRLTEIAYLDEIRNLGYEPLEEREDKRAKSFFHMLRWLKENPKMIRFAKTGWPRLARFRLFKNQDTKYEANCASCGKECEVPFRVTKKRKAYCPSCWSEKRRYRNSNQ